MDAFPLVGRYKLYKEGTRRIVQWLTRTAHCCRNKHVVFDDLERKAAKDEAGPHSSEHNRVPLTTRQIVKLAELIAEDESIEIPMAILEVTKDVITGRESCSAWHRSQRSDPSSAATPKDEGHTFFIDALRTVHDTLRTANRSHATGISSARPNDDKKRKHAQNLSEQDPLYNLFQHLQVEEPADDPFGTTEFVIDTIEESEASGESNAEEKERNERGFAVWCHFQDLEALREYVCMIWKQYVSGKKSLLAAGVVTNVAFSLMRHSCKERNRDGDMKHWCFDMRRATSEDGRLYLQDAGPDDSTTSEMFCHDATYILCVLTQELERSIFGANGDKEVNEESRSKDSYHARLFSAKGFGDILLSLAPAIMQVGLPKYHCTEEDDYRDWKQGMAFLDDEYLAGLVTHAYKGLRQRVIPSWLIAITKTCMEIHTILNGKTSGALTALRDTIEECDASFQACVDNFGNQLIRSQEYAAFAWSSGPYRSYERSGPEATDEDRNYIEATCYLAQAFPTMPACAQFHVQFRALSAGMLTMNKTLEVLTMAHLYKAAQQYGLVSKVWDDMEFIFTHFATSQPNDQAIHPIVTKPNANADPFAMARYFRMALGLPTVQCQRRGAVNLHKYRPRNTVSRQLMPKSALANSILHVETKACETMRETDMVRLLLQSMTAEEHKAKKSRRSQGNEKPTSAAVLDYFEKQMSLLEPVLNFKYIEFCLRCYATLSYLDETFRPGSKRLPEALESPSFAFVDLLLWNVAETVHNEQPRTSEERKEVVQGTNFGRVAQSLNMMIEDVGGLYTKQAMSKCSGHIPKSMSPEI